MINIGLLGIGGMGRMHFDCYSNNRNANLIAICDRNEAKRSGDWSNIRLNLDDRQSGQVDLSGLQIYSDVEKFLADPNINLVDICLPTPLHAATSIAAMRAGKHVFCEKPMALNEDECAQMEAAARETGQHLMIGHCLRYWPEYVRAHEIIRSGEWGRVLSASFHRSSAMPGGWMTDGAQSGGAVLDMHIHDVDTALWWFGEPDSIEADGFTRGNLPLSVDAVWRYNDGPLATFHGSWDPNGGPFRMAFRVLMERASLLYDSATNAFQLLRDGQSEDLKVSESLAYQIELDDFVRLLDKGGESVRVTPQSSRLALAVTRREMAQIAGGKRPVNL